MNASKWTFRKTLQLIRYVGVVPLEQAAEKLDCKRSYAIRQLQILNMMGKTPNGMPFNTFKKLFGKWPEYSLPGMRGSFRLVPWVWIAEEIESGRLETHDMYRMYIEAMAMFQRWIFEGNVMPSLEQIAKSNKPVRRTHCAHGHALTKKNIYIIRGWVKCTQCRRLKDDKRRALKRLGEL